jgi:drug/metabolite transporter (DMT)-like permease
MKEPNEDWLDQEIKRLPDLEAPPELLPKVMRSVQQRSVRRWVMSIFRQHLPFIKNSGLGFALAMLVLIPLFNPIAAVINFLTHAPLLRFLGAMLEVGGTILTNLRVFQLPLGWLVALVAGLSYLTCILAASTVRHLATAKRS